MFFGAAAAVALHNLLIKNVMQKELCFAVCFHCLEKQIKHFLLLEKNCLRKKPLENQFFCIMLFLKNKNSQNNVSLMTN